MEITPRIETPTQMRLISLRLWNMIVWDDTLKKHILLASILFNCFFCNMAPVKSMVRKNKLIRVAFVAILVFVGYNTYHIIRRSFALKQESVATRAKIKELIRHKQELEAQIMELKTASAVEREAKARLNMKNSGEEVVVVVPEKNVQSDKKPATTMTSFRDWVRGFFR